MCAGAVQSYHNISKNAIESQLCGKSTSCAAGSKLPQHFKECNRITTTPLRLTPSWKFKVTTTFQRMQSNHNSTIRARHTGAVQSYHNISKNAIESQLGVPRYRRRPLFKVTTTFQRMQSNHICLYFLTFLAKKSFVPLRKAKMPCYNFPTPK